MKPFSEFLKMLEGGNFACEDGLAEWFGTEYVRVDLKNEDRAAQATVPPRKPCAVSL